MLRKFRALMPLVAALAAVLAIQPSYAGTVSGATKTYELSGPLFSLTGLDVPAGTSDGTLDIGGVRFDEIGGTGTKNVTVKVDDSVLPADAYISVTACQDLDGDSTCGEGLGDATNPLQEVDEPIVSGCIVNHTTLTLTGAKRHFDFGTEVNTAEIVVFINLVDICDEGGSGGSGTVKVTFP